MRLDVTTGSAAEWDAAIALQDADISPAEFYLCCLETAYLSKEKAISFRSIASQNTQSDRFALIGTLERTILDFLKDHEYPETVRIICDTDETAQLYKVVYNFWFAADKPSRMQDDDWD